MINKLSNATISGGTDGTTIGNTGDRLRVDTSSGSGKSGSGSISALDGTVTANVQGLSTIIFNVTGTWVGTMRAEGTVDGGTTWLLLTATDASQAIFATNTVNNRWIINCGSYSQIRLRMSSYTSGTATVVWTADVGQNFVQAWNTNAVSLKSEVYGKDSTNATVVHKITANSDLKVSDGLHNGGVHGNLSLATANTTYEAKVGGARLANRKALSITALDDMYWGYDNTVTTSTGTPLFKSQVIIFDVDPDSTFQVWVVASANSKNARITESP